MKTFLPGSECIQCGVLLTEENWSKRNNAHKCKSCKNSDSRNYYHNNRERLLKRMRERDPEGRWEYNIKRWYGITAEEYYRILEEQNGGCGICGSQEPRGKRLKKFHIDHCHASGKVRGVLCGPCNLLIGAVNDDPLILETAAAYLRKNQ